MPDNVYKTIEVTGSSTEGIEDAVQGAVSKASGSLRNLEWFQVGEIRGHIENNSVAHYQVTVKLGFRLE